MDKGEIPAYRLGGTILRFRKDQIDRLKAHGVPKVAQLEQEDRLSETNKQPVKFTDFLYFNDFYIISAIIVVVLLAFIFFY